MWASKETLAICHAIALREAIKATNENRARRLANTTQTQGEAT
jgi:hypothetical protein